MALNTVLFPNFNLKDNVTLFFTLVDRYFVNNQVLDSNVKFDITISKLDSDILAKISNLVVNKPARRPYEILREELIQLFSRSNENRVIDLTSLKFVDSCNKLLQSALDISSGLNLPENYLKSLIFTKLPTSLKGYAKLLKTTLSLKDYCGKLDDIYDAIKTSDSCSAVNTDQQNTEYDILCNEIRDLKRQLHTSTSAAQECSPQPIQTQTRSNNFRQNNTNFQNYTHQSFPQRNTGVLCYYHDRFGDRAFKCNGPPCSFQKNL